MDEQELESVLANLIEEAGDETWSDGPVRSVLTFDEAGLMTNNSGLVVRIGTAEFQITVVRSR